MSSAFSLRNRGLVGQRYLVIIMAIIIGKFLIVKNPTNQP